PGQQYPWLEGKKLVEPFQNTEISIDKIANGAKYRFEILNDDGEVLNRLEGHHVGLTFEKVGNYLIRVTEELSNGEVTTDEHPAVCKYVRRELRTLFKHDREELLDAMSELWKVRDEEGQEKYGKEYTSIFSLLVYHLTLAGDRTCDHMHDGYGFMQHHSALSKLFERSLQAINPKLTLPYWDYIFDIEEWANTPEEERWDFTQGELFTAEWFGRTNSETHYVEDGRWAGLEVPLITEVDEAQQESTPRNAYGHMRAPWAANPDPHLMRAQTVCGQLSTVQEESAGRCSSLKSLWKQNTFEDFGHFISYLPHGRIHLLLGGAFGCEESLQSWHDIEEIKDAQWFDTDYAISLAFAMHKNLYRWGQIECDVPNEPCYCPDFEDLLDSESNMKEFLLDALFELKLQRFSHETKKKVVASLCKSGTIVGDNLQSSSSYSPEFWPIHGTVERMYQAKKLGYRGIPLLEDESYPEYGAGSWLVYHDYCEGHEASDPVLGGMSKVWVGEEARELTNEEYLQIMDPTRDTGLDYIYDHLSWDYCQDVFGVDIYN
ncbi:unnamed protein product, partial [Heterosigma akashiwo]